MKITTLVVSLLIVSMSGSAVLAQSFDGEPASSGPGSAGWPRFSFDYSNSNHNPFERTISRADRASALRDHHLRRVVCPRHAHRSAAVPRPDAGPESGVRPRPHQPASRGHERRRRDCRWDGVRALRRSERAVRRNDRVPGRPMMEVAAQPARAQRRSWRDDTEGAAALGAACSMMNPPGRKGSLAAMLAPSLRRPTESTRC
jgi:hypothetical protein